MAESTGKRTLILIITIIIVLGAGGSIWYWGFYKPEQEAKEQARLEEIARQEAEQKRIAQEAQKKARYDQLIADADAAFNQENWGSARSLYVEASSLFANEQYPKDQLVIVNGKLDEIAALEAKKAAGFVESVSEKTGRYYIIVSSSIDEDLAMDYAGRLAKEGNDVKVIEHDAPNHLFYRVALGDYAALDQAMAALPSFSNFSEAAWVLRF